MIKKALVTGANGHVGNNLVKALLDRGYKVRASVRDAADPARTASLPVSDIEVVGLDVRDERQFIEASGGVDTLFHAAATYKYYTGSRDADAEMIRDSVEGAAAAIHAAARNGIKRVVLTSSAVTVPLVQPGGPATTEEDWATDLRTPYIKAKVLAEQAAWRIAEAEHVNLVTVLPGAVIGPGFIRTTPSTDFVLGIMLGTMKMGTPDSNIPLIDVRDVVAGHILAAESGKGGRFLIVNDELPSMIEVTRMMHRIDPSVPAAKRNLPDFALSLGPFFDWLNHKTLGAPRMLTGEFIATIRGKEWTMSNARAKRELGWQQEIPLEQSLADTMAVLRALRGQRKAA